MFGRISTHQPPGSHMASPSTRILVRPPTQHLPLVRISCLQVHSNLGMQLLHIHVWHLFSLQSSSHDRSRNNHPRPTKVPIYNNRVDIADRKSDHPVEISLSAALHVLGIVPRLVHCCRSLASCSNP